MNTILPSETDLDNLFRKYHGDPKNHGWRVRMRHCFQYFSPNQWYHGLVDRLVSDGCRWIDVGGGKSVFPDARPLAADLAGRCNVLVGVDPSDNLDRNALVHERVKSTIQDFRTDETFDLATLRMVAEHIERPEEVVQSLARLIRPGGRVVIYTPNRWSLVSVVARMIPNRWHCRLANLLWNVGAADVFPTFYRMNTRNTLLALFQGGGFKEVAFAYLDDCNILSRFRATCFIELCVWRVLRMFGIIYPENDLVGVYEKT